VISRGRRSEVISTSQSKSETPNVGESVVPQSDVTETEELILKQRYDKCLNDSELPFRNLAS
jgi:hypothetical protein